MADYMASYSRRAGKAEAATKSCIDALILPPLGDVQLAKLTRRRIETWHEELTEAGARLRTKAGKPQKFREADQNPEARRRRRSTANRVLTVLKAALNHAFNERKISSDEAWRPVKPFREVDAARVRYLNEDESRRLVNAADVDFRPLVQAALLTGCRYGELTALTVSDYNADAGTVHVRISKSGKPRHVVLTEEGKRFFAAAALGKPADGLLLSGKEGKAWGKSHQHRPFKAACKAAKVADLTFHELRHTYASRLAMNAAPLAVIAAQLGHSDTRMVEKHYGHMSPSYVADTVRAAFGDLGIVPKASNVSALRTASTTG
jgi:integrase